MFRSSRFLFSVNFFHGYLRGVLKPLLFWICLFSSELSIFALYILKLCGCSFTFETSKHLGLLYLCELMLLSLHSVSFCPLVIFLALKSTLCNSNIVTLVIFGLVLALYVVFYSFSSNLSTRRQWSECYWSHLIYLCVYILSGFIFKNIAGSCFFPPVW